MAITGDTLFGYLNQAANRIPELQDRFQSNMKQDIGEELRNISSNMSFDDPVFNREAAPSKRDMFLAQSPDEILSHYNFSGDEVSNIKSLAAKNQLGVPEYLDQYGYNHGIFKNQDEYDKWWHKDQASQQTGGFNPDAMFGQYDPSNPYTSNAQMKAGGISDMQGYVQDKYDYENKLKDYNQSLSGDKTLLQKGWDMIAGEKKPPRLPDKPENSYQMPEYNYNVSGGNIPLNEDMYRKLIADQYQSKFGLDAGEAQRRVEDSGLFGRTAFLNKIEPHQKRMSEKVMDELRGVDFQTPDDYRKFMIDSGLMKIVNQLGPYAKNLGHAPDLKYNLGRGEMDLYDDIYK
jgi:hypothetical protein